MFFNMNRAPYQCSCFCHEQQSSVKLKFNVLIQLFKKYRHWQNFGMLSIQKIQELGLKIHVENSTRS